MKKNLRALLSFIALLAIFPAVAHASEAKLIGEYGDWSAWVFTENGNKVCYMASQPKKAEGNYTQRGDIYALITHRPADGSKNVFSYITGYTFKAGSDATVNIGKDRYTLFTQNDTAWTPDAETDTKLSKSIKNGFNMIVKGTSARGTLTTDTFGLKGSTAAHDAISQECGV